MKRIYKYTLTQKEYQQLELPKGAQILSIQGQGSVIVVWALIDPSETFKQIVELMVVLTGFDCNPDGWEYHSTCQMYSGTFVAHVFLKTNQ